MNIFDIPLIRKLINKNPLKIIKYVNKAFYEDFNESRIENQKKFNEIIFKDLIQNNTDFIIKCVIKINIYDILTDLNLSNSNIIYVPNSIGLLNILYNLDLSCNKIRNLPEIFGNIQLGGSLNLSNNELETLPESFGNLLCLKYNLLLQNNSLKTLPEFFGFIQ